VDGLYFYPIRPTATASNAASKTSYGQRDQEVTDDKLHSDSECQKRAETLLYQRKDAPIQITVRTPGNTNILVGDRLSMTIPAENITAQNYDVISVEHAFSMRGFLTTATMVNSANVREPMSITGQQNVIKMRREIKGLSRNEQVVG